MGVLAVRAKAAGEILLLEEGLSFWGGVDPATGQIIDANHPQHGASLAGRIVMMPTSRGSCTGSGVLLELALNGHAPAALVFREAEDILTLGALIAGRMFDRSLAVVRLGAADYTALAGEATARIEDRVLEAGALRLELVEASAEGLELSETDRAILNGAKGKAAQLAMEVTCTMAAGQGAERLTDVSRVHIDGCIYASPANLRFAEAMAEMGGQVVIPTTMNAISVDRENWQSQGVPQLFGDPASRLADAYVRMGAKPSFTCAPYLLEERPSEGEDIAWAESNAVIYANAVLGARTVKHPDFLDLFIALTGRAPLSGVYLQNNRRPARVIEVTVPGQPDDGFWPMLGWLVGQAAPDCIPLIRGVDHLQPNEDDLKGLCAAFGTTSAAPMLHVAGVTPESGLLPLEGAEVVTLDAADFARVWAQFNAGGGKVDLVALGSPHFSLTECHRLVAALDGRPCDPATTTLVTLGRATLAAAKADGTLAALDVAGVRVVPDICWCSISEPVFPPEAKVLMTNSGKYAHYAPGLCGRAVRFGGLQACAETAVSGVAPEGLPDWLG